MPGDSLIGKRIRVLDKGYIELLDLMPHPDTGVSGDLAIVNAARVSYLGESSGSRAKEAKARRLRRRRGPSKSWSGHQFQRGHRR